MRATKKPGSPAREQGAALANASGSQDPRPDSRGVSGVLIPVPNIEPSRFNPRKHFDPDKLAELTQSVRQFGVLQAIVVRPTYRTGHSAVERETYWTSGPLGQGTGGPASWPNMGYELVAGERRWRAAKAAGMAEMPATVLDLTDKEVREIQVVENEQRDDLPALEKAAGYRQLIDKDGYTVDDLAAKIGKSASTIYGLLKLFELAGLSKKAYGAIASGALTASTALLIARVPGEKARAELVTLATTPDHWDKTLPSLRDVQETIRRDYMTELKQAPFSVKDEALVPAAGSCEKCPKRTGNDKLNYPDSRDDVCTDPECYRGKLKAHNERVIKLAKEEGKEVLTGKEAEKALGYGGGYLDLKDRCYEDKKQRPYGQIIRAEVEDKVVVCVDTHGETHKLVPKAVAAKALKDKGIKKHVYGGDSADNKRRAEEAKQKKEVYRRALGQVADKAERIVARWMVPDVGEGAEFLETLLTAMAEYSWSDACAFVIKRRGLEANRAKRGGVREAMDSLIEELPGPKLIGLFAELVAARQAINNLGPYSGAPDAGEKAFWSFFGVDLKAIGAAVKAEKAGSPTRKRGTALANASGSQNGHGKPVKSENGQQQLVGTGPRIAP